MKLLLLDQFSELGGAQQMLLDLLGAIQDRGWQAALAAGGRGALMDRAGALGCEAISIQCGPYASGQKSLADLGRFTAELVPLARQIRRLADRFEPNLIYVNGPRLLPATALARCGRPVLFHAHINISQGPARFLAGAALKPLQAHVVAVCRMVADSWRPFVSDERMQVIYNGVAGPALNASKKRTGGPRIGCIGRIAPEKGQLEFLASAGQIHRRLPECRFVVCGAPLFSDAASVAYEQKAREAASGLPVEFSGWVTDVYDVMKDLDLLLVPSMWAEPNPRVILEAFAAGVPVIAFSVGGIPEIVEHGRNGFLCRDRAEMARLAVELLEGDPMRLCAVSQAARECWLARFTQQRWRQQILDAVERTAR